jgi:N-acetylglucosamine malate deacetylase 1
MTQELDYLILGAHPDDAELWCGGLILKMRQAGYAVGLCDCTRGEAGTHGTVVERDAETALANEIIKPAMRVNLGLPDGGLTDDLASRQAIVRVIRQYRLGPCRHPDHTALWQLARSVHFFSGAGGFPCDLPTFRPLRVIYHLEFLERTPTFIVDVSAQFEDKMRAIAAYSSQFYVPGKSPPKSSFIGSQQFYDRLVARHAYFGSLIGVAYGEPYVIEEALRLDDPLRNAREG